VRGQRALLSNLADPVVARLDDYVRIFSGRRRDEFGLTKVR
jgi:hypothetical protein